MIEIRVIRSEAGSFEVWKGENTSGQLSMGEMLETVLKLLTPEFPGPRYAMRTPEEWEARFSRAGART